MIKTIVSAAVLSAAFLGAATVQAQESRGELDYPPAVEQTSSLSRAEVVQARDLAIANGEIFQGNLDPALTYFTGTDSSASRQQVVQERNQAQQAGQISRGNLDYPPTHG